MPRAADLRPLLGSRRCRPGAARFLVICFYDPNGVGTVYESIAHWQQLSEFELEILNLWPLRGGALRLPSTLDLAEYDGLIVHAAVSYTLSNLEALDSQLPRPFEQFDGVKVLMKQDEQCMPALFADYLGRKRYDLLLTCLPEQERPKVYPRDKVGDLAFVQVLTGYVTAGMRSLMVPWTRSRPIDIGYRGSIQPLCFGRLGFEKRKIGEDVKRALAGRASLHLDISSFKSDRIYGAAWMNFLTSCKSTLGVESGSNLFDFDGNVEKWCDAFQAAHPELDNFSEEFYRSADIEHLCNFEGNIDYAQVSPRHFEAAAARSVQILYDGRYSDIFKPNRHFLPLARDLSNLDYVVGILADERLSIEMTECAFEEIVRSPSLGYEGFVAKVDPALDDILQRKQRKTGIRRRSLIPHRNRPRAVILTAADPVQDPRFDWAGKSFALDHDVVEIGGYRFGTDGGGPSIESLSKRRIRLRVERTRHGSWWIPHPTAVTRSLSCGRQKLLYLAALADAPEALLQATIGALDVLPEDLGQFRFLARHVINSNAALLEAAQRIGSFDVIVATDLDTLAAGVILKDETDGLLVYDAHEFWPYALHGMRHWQSEFWASFSRELVAAADLAITVSPPLAEVMAQEYGRSFYTVPNCASLAEADSVDIERKLAKQLPSEKVLFLFQGAFAPGRGLEQLISAWQYADPKAQLLLRGPGSEFKDTAIAVARSFGLLDRSVFFPASVTEDRLIAAASEADIGLIPYEPISINNRLSCPNKLSQYFAAGLPVVCNQLDFVRSVVVDNGIGYAVDFRDPKAVAAVVNNLVAAPDQIRVMAHRARHYFDTQFHWEHVFEPVRRAILDLEAARGAQRGRGELDLSWADDQKTMRSTSTEAARASAIQIVEMVENNPVAEATLRTAGLIGRVGALLKGPDRAARIAASLRYRARRYLRQNSKYAAQP